MSRPPGCVCPAHDTYGDCSACQTAYAEAELADPHPANHQEIDRMTSLLLRPADWTAHAACADADSKLFEPSTSDKPQDVITRIRVARLYCQRCPVRAACAAQADDRHEVGIWGGAHRYRLGSGYGKYVVESLIPAAARRAVS